MIRRRIIFLILVIFALLINSALALDMPVDPEGYLDYSLPEGVIISAGETADYILSWKFLPDVYEYRIGVFRAMEGRSGKVEFFTSSSGGVHAPRDGKDDIWKVYTLPQTLYNSLVLAGDATEANLGDMIVTIGPDLDPTTGYKTEGYYCLVMIVPQDGEPITQLIPLPHVTTEDNANFAQTATHLMPGVTDEGKITSIQQLINFWIDQYPLGFDVTDIEESDLGYKVNMDVAMKIAFDHIIDNYDFTFEQLAESSPQVIFSDFDDAWLVHVIPRNMNETFSVTVDSETGIITYSRYGGPTG